MILRFIFLFLVIPSILLSQQKKFSTQGKEELYHLNDQIYFSYWINPVQFDENLILNYHIRYDFLLFEKTASDTFQARIKIMLELNSPGQFLPIRSIEEAIIKTSDFNQTISNNIFYKSHISLKIPPKEYTANLRIFDEIRNKEYQLPQFKIDLEDSTNFSLIFIREFDLLNIAKEEIKNLFFNFLPFSAEKYLLIVPRRNNLDSISISNKFVNYKLLKKENTGLRFNIFALDTLELYEGKYILTSEQNRSINKEFEVRWIDKPEYLKNLDKATKILKYVFDDDKLLEKSRGDKDLYIHEFYKLWKKYDPTPATAFNELLFQFYKRADYASFEYRSVSQTDGALTDRGKIYIIYGQPSNIERNFSKDGRAIEVWTYNSSKNLKFIFFDENKNGDYILQQ